MLVNTRATDATTKIRVIRVLIGFLCLRARFRNGNADTFFSQAIIPYYEYNVPRPAFVDLMGKMIRSGEERGKNLRYPIHEIVVTIEIFCFALMKRNKNSIKKFDNAIFNQSETSVRCFFFK